MKMNFSLQHVDEENCYLCGYLKITGLTSEFPTLTTFFDAEIISKRYPFLTRKWDADEDVDRKHWVSLDALWKLEMILMKSVDVFRGASQPLPITRKTSTQMTSPTMR